MSTSELLKYIHEFYNSKTNVKDLKKTIQISISELQDYINFRNPNFSVDEIITNATNVLNFRNKLARSGKGNFYEFRIEKEKVIDCDNLKCPTNLICNIDSNICEKPGKYQIELPLNNTDNIILTGSDENISNFIINKYGDYLNLSEIEGLNNEVWHLEYLKDLISKVKRKEKNKFEKLNGASIVSSLFSDVITIDNINISTKYWPSGLNMIPDLLSKNQQKELYKFVLESNWKQPEINKYYVEDYEIQMYGRINNNIYINIPLILKCLMDALYEEKILNKYPNQIVINKYIPFQYNTIGEHNTNPDTVILSLGSSVKTVFRVKNRFTNIPLLPGSLLLISGESKTKWTHEIKKENYDDYISIIFRYIEL